MIGFNLVMLLLLEAPLLSFKIAPEWTPAAVAALKERIGRHGRRFAVWGFAAVGAALVLKGLIGLL